MKKRMWTVVPVLAMLGVASASPAQSVVDKTKDALSKTGEAMTDGWITSRVHQRFVSDDLLKDSDIKVDTEKHVVTLTGTVTSAAGRAKAATIAGRTEGVHRVNNRLTADSQIGTWKLNVAKSTYSPGPAPASGTSKIEADGAGRKLTIDQPQADGSTRHWTLTANYDGKDTALTGNNPDADTQARTRVSASTVRTISKKGGAVTTTQTSTVSADGKRRTVRTTGTNGAGTRVNNVAVYDRQ